MTAAKTGDQIEAGADPDTRGEGALRGGLNRRSVGDRVREGDPELDHVGSALDDNIEQLCAGFQVRIAQHQERAERTLAARG